MMVSSTTLDLAKALEHSERLPAMDNVLELHYSLHKVCGTISSLIFTTQTLTSLGITKRQQDET